MRRVSRAAELYRERVLTFLSSTLEPSGFFEIELKDTTRLLSVFAKSLEQNGRALFVGEDGLVDELSTDDVKLICALAWRADGNGKRQLPECRFVSDSTSASKFESGSRSAKKQAGMLVVATDRPKKSRVELIVNNDNLAGIHVASITGGTEKDTNVDNIFISYTKADENWARWIASILQSAGYAVTVQYKDFVPGSNFVQQMDQAVENTDRTVAVLSSDYLKSERV
jgi:hypothetical protein